MDGIRRHLQLLLLFLVIASIQAAGKRRTPKFNPKNKPEMGAKIINGKVAKKNQVPYQIFVVSHGTHNSYCGGSLIDGGGNETNSNDFVLTAAHCIQGSSVNKISVYAGMIDRYNDENVQRKVTDIYFYHNEDKERRLENDIVLLKLDESFPWTMSQIQRVPLPSHPPEVMNCLTSGWGDNEVAGITDVTKLNVLEVPIIPRKDCLDAYPNIQEDRFCAGFMKGGKDTCKGDSGGPLVCGGVLTGIVEGGESCALPGKPGTYTNVYYYINWINVVISGLVKPDRTLQDTASVPAANNDENSDLDDDFVDENDVDANYNEYVDYIPPEFFRHDVDPDFERMDNNNGVATKDYFLPTTNRPEINNPSKSLKPSEEIPNHDVDTIVHYVINRYSVPAISISTNKTNLNIALHITIDTKQGNILK